MDSVRNAEDFAARCSVSRETLDDLIQYESLLRRWQSVKNLVAEDSLDDIWHRHFFDSAQLVELAPTDARTWVDLGSGAGFPGFVVALLKKADPQFTVHLIEANGRKCTFLRELKRLLNAPVEIHNQRIESRIDSVTVKPADVVSARALAPLDKLLAYAEPFFAQETIGLFLKGKNADSEIEAAQKHWCFAYHKIASQSAPEGCVIKVTNLAGV